MANFSPNFVSFKNINLMIPVQYLHEAVQWKNGSRDFDRGIALLRGAKFRPGVVNKLEKDKQRPGSAERLLVNINALISAFCRDDESLQVDTDPDVHVFEGEEDTTTAQPTVEKGILAHENDEGNIGIIIKRYADLYRQRDMAHRQLKQVGEKNDDASCILRKQLAEQIEQATDMMEAIYPYYEKFTTTGEQPSDDDVSRLTSEPKPVDAPVDDSQSVDISSMSKEDLTKLQYNLAKRISRSRNKLLYQSENKLEQENPLPDGPKRIKLEKRIASLEKELDAVKLRIAELS